jgi:hypothetical protein
MPDWSSAGKAIALLGVLLVLIGALVALLGKLPGWGHGMGWLGKLPGDILIKRDSFSFYFPLTTSILISIVLSILVYLMSWFKR